jgi:hypothetical protein
MNLSLPREKNCSSSCNTRINAKQFTPLEVVNEEGGFRKGGPRVVKLWGGVDSLPVVPSSTRGLVSALACFSSTSCITSHQLREERVAVRARSHASAASRGSSLLFAASCEYLRERRPKRDVFVHTCHHHRRMCCRCPKSFPKSIETDPWIRSLGGKGA